MNNLFKITRLILGCYLILFLVGCTDAPPSEEVENQPSTKYKPGLSFHRPKELAKALDRIGELHAAVMAKGSLPAPLKIKYVEVIHGEGDSAHSHYYLASRYFSAEKGELDTHEDENIKETVEERELKVDCITELYDLTRWLPSIAAATDLDEDDWNQIKKHSESLKGIIEPFLETKKETDFCQAWKSNSEQIKDILAELQQIIKSQRKD